MIRRRTRPIYIPSIDASLTIWLDATDTSLASLQNTSGGTITNGATIGQWASKAGTARKFKQDSSGHVRPTWESAGWMGLPAVRCNAHNGSSVNGYAEILVADVLTGFQNISGVTAMAACYVVSPVITTNTSSLNGSCFIITVPHDTGSADTSMVYLACNGVTWNSGGRRLQSDGFQSPVNVTATYPAAQVETIALHYATAQADEMLAGVEQGINQPFQTAGNNANKPPFAIAIGGLSQEVADPTHPSPGAALQMDGYIGEILCWNQYLTPDQLVAPHDYLCYRWGAGKM